MKNFAKLTLIFILICVSLSGCKKSAAEVSEKSSTSSHTPMPPEKLWADYTSNGDTSGLIIGDDEKHISREITAKCVIAPSETRTVKFDLDIPETPDITAYNHDFPKCGQYELTDIMSVFYGEAAKDFVPFEDTAEVYHNSKDASDNSIALFDKGTGKLYLVYRDAAAMDFSSANMLKSADEMTIDITEDNAISLCEKFLRDCNITGYKYGYTNYYGVAQSAFYSICYYYELDSLPASSSISNGEGFCNLIFHVDDNGIAAIKGSLFDENSFFRQNSIDAAQIISPREAINYVAKQAAVIRAGNQNPIFDEYFSQKGEGLLYLPICEMKFGYWFSKNDGIKLSWIFYIGENGIIDRGAAFAIDALTGKVYNQT